MRYQELRGTSTSLCVAVLVGRAFEHKYTASDTMLHQSGFSLFSQHLCYSIESYAWVECETWWPIASKGALIRVCFAFHGVDCYGCTCYALEKCGTKQFNRTNAFNARMSVSEKQLIGMDRKLCVCSALKHVCVHGIKNAVYGKCIMFDMDYAENSSGKTIEYEV